MCGMKVRLERELYQWYGRWGICLASCRSEIPMLTFDVRHGKINSRLVCTRIFMNIFPFFCFLYEGIAGVLGKLSKYVLLEPQKLGFLG